MATVKPPLSNADHPFWTDFANPTDIEQFHTSIRELQPVFVALPNCPSDEVLKKMTSAFTKASELNGLKPLSADQQTIYEAIKKKIFWWGEGAEKNAAHKAIRTFETKCKISILQASKEAISGEQPPTAASPQTAPPIIPLRQPRAAFEFVYLTNVKLEEQASSINSSANTKFHFVGCSYDASGKTSAASDTQIVWKKFSHLTLSGFTSPSLDLSSAENLQQLIIEDSPALKSVFPNSFPKLQQLILKNNASVEQSSLSFLSQMPAEQLKTLRVVVINCPKITKEAFQPFVEKGLILEYTAAPSKNPPPLKKPRHFSRWLVIVGIASLVGLALAIANRWRQRG